MSLFRHNKLCSASRFAERQDYGFHIYRQMCQYLFKLGTRCIKPKSLARETDLSGILNVAMSVAKALAVPDFIARSKLDQRLNVACRISAEKNLINNKGNRCNLLNLVKEAKEELSRLGRSYVAYLFHAAQSNLQLTVDILRGWAHWMSTSCFVLLSVRRYTASDSSSVASIFVVTFKLTMSLFARRSICPTSTNSGKKCLNWTNQGS